MTRNTKHAPAYIQHVPILSSCVFLLQAAHKSALNCPKYNCDQVVWVPAMLNSSAGMINR